MQRKEHIILIISIVIWIAYSYLVFVSYPKRILPRSEKGGLIVIALPEEKSLVRVFVDHYFRDHQTHLYAFSVDGIIRLLEANSFKVLKFFVDLPLTHRRWLWWISDIFQKFPPQAVLWMLNAFWVIGIKNTSRKSK